MSRSGQPFIKPAQGQSWIWRGCDAELYPDGLGFLIVNTEKIPSSDDFVCYCNWLQWCRAGDTKYNMLTMTIHASTLVFSEQYTYWVRNPEHWSKLKS